MDEDRTASRPDTILRSRFNNRDAPPQTVQRQRGSQPHGTRSDNDDLFVHYFPIANASGARRFVAACGSLSVL